MTALAGLLAATTVLSGCAVYGKWSVAQVDPDAARRDVEFSSLTLQRDGSFYAEADKGDGIESTSGTYIYDKGLLTLVEHDGERHAYEARLVSSGRELKLMRHWKDRRLYIKLEREE